MEYDVFFFDSFPPVIYQLRDGQWVAEPRDERASDVEPSLTLKREMLEEFVRAAAGHVHAEDATVKHLDDATATRDRLLSMIEKRGLR